MARRLVKLIQNKDGSPIVNGLRIGRNDPCPCKSGNKWKKCRMQRPDCQICPTCGQMKSIYQQNKTGELFFKCKVCDFKENVS